jgi:DNA-binding CsgD family transcriptional regulator
MTNTELTPTELKIVKILCEGKCNKDIAKELNLCCKTVKNHVARVFLKFKVLSRTELMHYCFKHGIVKVDVVIPIRSAFEEKTIATTFDDAFHHEVYRGK